MVLAVSCGPYECVVVALIVPTSRSCHAGREKVRPAALCLRECAKKFAQRAHNTPILVFLGLLGELFRGNAAGGAVLGEFFRVNRCAEVL